MEKSSTPCTSSRVRKAEAADYTLTSVYSSKSKSRANSLSNLISTSSMMHCFLCALTIDAVLPAEVFYSSITTYNPLSTEQPVSLRFFYASGSQKAVSDLQDAILRLDYI